MHVSDLPNWALAGFGGAFALAAALATALARWGLGEWRRSVQADVRRVSDRLDRAEARADEQLGRVIDKLDALDGQVTAVRETLADVRATVRAMGGGEGEG